jgi:membrane protease YdiL (CAAX protease family)
MAGKKGHGWAFIDLAGLGVNTVRSYLVTLLRVVVLPAGFLFFAFAALYAAAARHLLPHAGVPAAVLAIGFATVVVLGLALARSVARSHRRPWMSLISPDLALDYRRLAIGVGVEGALLVIFVAAAYFLIGSRPPAGGGTALTLPAAAVAIALTPFQAASEEMLFRGYLTQGLGRVLRSRVAIAAIVGILFAAAHFNAYGPLTMPYLFLLSLIYSLVSLRDERLELTIGAHTATNWFAMALGYATGISPTAVHVKWPMIAMLLLNGALFYGLTRLFVRRFCERRPAGAPAAP